MNSSRKIRKMERRILSEAAARLEISVLQKLKGEIDTKKGTMIHHGFLFGKRDVFIVFFEILGIVVNFA